MKMRPLTRGRGDAKQRDGADSQERHALCKEKSKGRATFPCRSFPTLGGSEVQYCFDMHWNPIEGHD